jgi:hypothetical protein
VQYQPQSVQGQQHQITDSSTSTLPNIKPQSPRVVNWSSYSSMDNPVDRSSKVDTNESPPILPSPLSASPSFVRTSMLKQMPNPAQPELSKIFLELEGDLKSMIENWTKDERSMNRRIVMFNRSQSRHTITTTFRIATEKIPPKGICISCIYWEAKSEYFVTCTDIILLFEQLLTTRFTTKEKNRIRRNLSSLKPVTVSKAKPDSKEFYNLIMRFPEPKPRSIAKDIKVFRWEYLGYALRKVVSKYVSITRQLNYY